MFVLRFWFLFLHNKLLFLVVLFWHFACCLFVDLILFKFIIFVLICICDVLLYFVLYGRLYDVNTFYHAALPWYNSFCKLYDCVCGFWFLFIHCFYILMLCIAIMFAPLFIFRICFLNFFLFVYSIY